MKTYKTFGYLYTRKRYEKGREDELAYYTSLKFANYIRRLKNRKFFIFIKNGNLVISKNKGEKVITITSYPKFCRIAFSLPKELARRLKKKSTNKITIFFEGFNRNLVAKYDEKFVRKLGARAGIRALKRKYGVDYARILSKLSIIKRKKLRSLLESEIVKITTEAGIPATLWEPDLKNLNGVPDLLLIGRIIVEIVGDYRDVYIRKLKMKVSQLLKSQYKVILVAEDNRVRDKIKKVIPNAAIFLKKEYKEWVNNYYKFLSERISDFNIEYLGDYSGIS